MTEELIINTAGWIEISCDKCGTSSLYHPDNPMNKCFGCMPVTTSEEFDKMSLERKLK